jgi:hypothetical protein
VSSDSPSKWKPCNRPLSPAEQMYLYRLKDERAGEGKGMGSVRRVSVYGKRKNGRPRSRATRIAESIGANTSGTWPFKYSAAFRVLLESLEG